VTRSTVHAVERVTFAYVRPGTPVSPWFRAGFTCDGWHVDRRGQMPHRVARCALSGDGCTMRHHSAPSQCVMQAGDLGQVVNVFGGNVSNIVSDGYRAVRRMPTNPLPASAIQGLKLRNKRGYRVLPSL
jgi:hypothetical protein